MAGSDPNPANAWGLKLTAGLVEINQLPVNPSSDSGPVIFNNGNLQVIRRFPARHDVLDHDPAYGFRNIVSFQGTTSTVYRGRQRHVPHPRHRAQRDPRHGAIRGQRRGRQSHQQRGPFVAKHGPGCQSNLTRRLQPRQRRHDLPGRDGLHVRRRARQRPERLAARGGLHPATKRRRGLLRQQPELCLRRSEFQ